MENKKYDIEPDIEIKDSYGKLKFYNLSSRQFEIIKTYKEIQRLSILFPNDQEFGKEIRKLIKGG